MFKLWIDHGKDPQNASYSYIVVPGISQKEFSKKSPYQELNILSNTNVMQAVFSTQLKILQVVFYKSGALHVGKTTISVSEPCVLMLEKVNTIKPVIYVADPSHQLKNILIKIGNEKINCTLPANEYAGSTIKVNGLVNK